MQYFLIWASNRRNTAPKNLLTEDSRKSIIVFKFSFSYLCIRSSQKILKTRIRYPQTGIKLLFSGYFFSSGKGYYPERIHHFLFITANPLPFQLYLYYRFPTLSGRFV